MIKLVWMTDTHTIREKNASVLDGMRRAVLYAEANGFDAIVNTGDIGDNNADNCSIAMQILRSGTTPLLWCNGNHSEQEYVPGLPTTSDFEAAECWNMSAPFFHTDTIIGDSGEVARVIMTDAQFYHDSPDGSQDSPNHTNGDRIGWGTHTPLGGYYRELGTEQVTWIRETLVNDSTSDYIIVMTHYPPSGRCVDYNLLLDELQFDGRPVIILCGHVHNNARTYEVQTTDGNNTYTFYKCLAALETNSFTRLAVVLDESTPIVSQAIVHNYTQPLASWSIASPFSVADELRILRKV